MAAEPDPSDKSLAAALQQALGDGVTEGLELEQLLDGLLSGEIGGGQSGSSSPPSAARVRTPTDSAADTKAPGVVRLPNGNRVRAGLSVEVDNERIERIGQLYGLSEPLAGLVAQGKLGAKTAQGLQRRIHSRGRQETAVGLPPEKLRLLVLGGIAVVLLLILVATT